MDNNGLIASQWLDPRYFTRRDFLTLSSLSATALALGMISGCDRDPDGVINLRNFKLPKASGNHLTSFIFIDALGKVTLVSHRPDVGNGTPQAMLMLLAEELEVDLEDVDVIQASANEAAYGYQYIGASNSVRGSWLPSRKVGAAARDMLITAAAEIWMSKKEECIALKGQVVHLPSNRKLHYGELVDAAAKLSPPNEPPLKAMEDFKIIGKNLKRKMIPTKTNGSAIYGLDLKVDDMLYASIERSPVFHGIVRSFNEAEVLAIPGVRYVVKTEMMVLMKVREGVAVVADNYWTAVQGRKVLKVKWDDGDMAGWDSDRIMTQYREDSTKSGEKIQSSGDFNLAIKSADHILEAAYHFPSQVHAPLEPGNVTADARGDRCTIWGPIQAPNWVRLDVAGMLELPLEKVEVHPSVIGGGFGRKGYTDFCSEAAFLSQKINSPVKVIWTREDEMTQGPFHPGSRNILKAGFDKTGALTAFSHKLITTDYYKYIPFDDTIGIMEGVTTHAYDFPNLSYDVVRSEVPIPYIWMRSGWCSNNGFAQECFIDELAHKIGANPLDVRLTYLRKTPRFNDVLEKLADVTGWRSKKRSGTGRGMAIMRLRDSIVGHVAELSRREDGKIGIDKITAVIDCGIVINPDIVRQQVEGAIVMGLSLSFKKEITISKGQVDQKNFDTYPILRFSECPAIDVHIIASKEDPGGVGEVGMPGAAPAVANAYFDLTGKRIRKLPFDLNSG